MVGSRDRRPERRSSDVPIACRRGNCDVVATSGWAFDITALEVDRFSSRVSVRDFFSAVKVAENKRV